MFLLLSLLMAGFICASVLLTVLAMNEESEGVAASARRSALRALACVAGASGVNIAFSVWLDNPFPLIGLICYVPLLHANVGRYRRLRRSGA